MSLRERCIEAMAGQVNYTALVDKSASPPSSLGSLPFSNTLLQQSWYGDACDYRCLRGLQIVANSCRVERILRSSIKDKWEAVQEARARVGSEQVSWSTAHSCLLRSWTVVGQVDRAGQRDANEMAR